MAHNEQKPKSCRDLWAMDVESCRARVAGISDLIACLSEKFSCPCMVYFGAGRFCNHPANKRIAEASNKK